jgi:hypothetical protein
MRAGILISALSHVVLVLLALFGTPKLFESVPSPSIEVELVPPPEQVDTKPKPEPDKDTLAFDLPAASSSPPPAPAQPPPVPAQPPSASAQPHPAPAQPPPPERSRQAALAPQQPQATGPTTPGGSQPDPINAPALFDLLNAVPGSLDFKAITAANQAARLSDAERTAFKAHLRKCWKLPGGAAPAADTFVVLRIHLSRDARLIGDPELVQGKGTSDGLNVKQTAERALKACQPFSFLPATKHDEWRSLDLRMTPDGLADGG